MYLISVLSLLCVILSVTCAPQGLSGYWNSDEGEDSLKLSPYWINSRRSSYPSSASSIYGSFGDEMTRMLEELQKSLEAARIGSQFPAQSGNIPVFDISTSFSDESDEPHVSISGTGLGGFGNIGGFDTKNLKNKTTVKTEVIDGHKVTVKESTYVSDQDGIQSVVHISEVDLAGSEESDEETKTSTATTPKSNEDETPKVEETEDKPKEISTVAPEEENQTPDADISKSDEEPEPVSKNNEDNEVNNSEETQKRFNRHPDRDVEVIDADDVKNYYNYKYNSNSKLKAKEDDLLDSTLLFIFGDSSDSIDSDNVDGDNELDSILSRRRRHASRVANHAAAPVKQPVEDSYPWPWGHINVNYPQIRHTREAGVINLQGDTRVNQILSEKQHSSGLYSIAPDAELLDENFYEVEGHRPGNQQQILFYNQNRGQYPNQPQGNYGNQYNKQSARRPEQYQRRPNYQERPPRYDNDYQSSDVYQATVPVASSPYVNDYQQTVPINRGDQTNPEADEYQRTVPVSAADFQVNTAGQVVQGLDRLKPKLV